MASNALEQYKIDIHERMIKEGLRALKEGLEQGIITTRYEFMAVLHAATGTSPENRLGMFGGKNAPPNHLYIGILMRIGRSEVGHRMTAFEHALVLRGLTELLEE